MALGKFQTFSINPQNTGGACFGRGQGPQVILGGCCGEPQISVPLRTRRCHPQTFMRTTPPRVPFTKPLPPPPPPALPFDTNNPPPPPPPPPRVDPRQELPSPGALVEEALFMNRNGVVPTSAAHFQTLVRGPSQLPDVSQIRGRMPAGSLARNAQQLQALVRKPSPLPDVRSIRRIPSSGVEVRAADELQALLRPAAGFRLQPQSLPLQRPLSTQELRQASLAQANQRINTAAGQAEAIRQVSRQQVRNAKEREALFRQAREGLELADPQTAMDLAQAVGRARYDRGFLQPIEESHPGALVTQPLPVSTPARAEFFMPVPGPNPSTVNQGAPLLATEPVSALFAAGQGPSFSQGVPLTATEPVSALFATGQGPSFVAGLGQAAVPPQAPPVPTVFPAPQVYDRLQTLIDAGLVEEGSPFTSSQSTGNRLSLEEARSLPQFNVQQIQSITPIDPLQARNVPFRIEQNARPYQDSGPAGLPPLALTGEKF